jgi:hypothetical protein
MRALTGGRAAVAAPGGRVSTPALGRGFRWVALVVALKSALDLAFAGRHGWQRDKLYSPGGLVTVPIAVAGLRLLRGDRRTRPLALARLGTLLAYLGLNRNSYYTGPVVYFARCSLRGGSLRAVWPRLLEPKP